MKKTLFLLALIACIATSHAQPTDSYKKNSVGLDLVPIVQNMVHGDSLIPYGITYRRMLTPRLAVRARFDVGYKSSSQPQWSEFFHYSKKRQSFGVGLGYEYVLPLRSWADFSCGLSVAYRWSKTSIREKWQEAISGVIVGDVVVEEVVYDLIDMYEVQPLSHQYFVQPFVGLTFHISKQVSILSEFSPYYSYAEVKHTYDRSEIRNTGGASYAHMTPRHDMLHEINARCSISLQFNF